MELDPSVRQQQTGGVDDAGAEALSSFDHWRRTIGMVAGPILALVILFAPFAGLTTAEQRLAAIAALIVVFWVTEAVPLPVGSLMALGLIVVAGVSPAGEVLSAFGDQVIFLFIGSFMLARIMQVHGVDRRIAYYLLAHPWVGQSTYRTIWAVGLTAWLLSMWISNTASVAMLLPVVLAIGRLTGELLAESPNSVEADSITRRYMTGLLLMLAYSASLGGLVTPVGTPPNLIGIALIDQGTGTRIGFVEWMTVAGPLSVILLGAAYGVVMLRFRPAAREVPGQLNRIHAAQQDLGAWTVGQRNSLVAFLVAVTLWLVPGIVSLILGADHEITTTLQDRLPEGVVALLAATLLFMLPTDFGRRQFTATWDQAAEIDWGTILLFGGGIALGRTMIETGLAGTLGDGIFSAIGADRDIIVSGISVLTAALMSEVGSNTASVNIVLPVILAAAETLPISSLTLGVAGTLGASMGFMLPVSTPPNAIVYGSGQLRIIDMVTTGVLLDVIGIIVIWLGTLLLVPVML